MRRDHQSTDCTRAHDEHREFRDWPKSAIAVLRAMWSGEWMDTEQIEEESRILGERITYASARGGARWLVSDAHPSYYRRNRYKSGRGIYAEESARRGRAIQRLTPRGKELAALSLRIFPARDTPIEVAGDAERSPPDPVTPLWRVLHDHGETLVIAADRQAALALFERETEEVPSRAEPIDTSAPMLLNWTMC
jgi:hypothetical protein